MNKETKDLIDAASMLLDRLDTHGNIDHIREEGPIKDLRNALENIKSTDTPHEDPYPEQQ